MVVKGYVGRKGTAKASPKEWRRGAGDGGMPVMGCCVTGSVGKGMKGCCGIGRGWTMGP